MEADTLPSTAEVWDWLGQVPDPEIPVISLTDLGIVRNVEWENDTLVVTVTPTQTGPHLLSANIEQASQSPMADKVAINYLLTFEVLPQ